MWKKPNTAFFCFHGRLNDFLPLEKRDTWVPYRFEGSPAVRDPLQALGVPHVEVEALTVDGKPVGFAYRMTDTDRVEAFQEVPDSGGPYPVLHPPLPEVPRFVLDVHLGRLARYLRMFGFDSLYDNSYEDPEIVRLAADQGRIVLTRDIGILKYGSVQWGYCLRSRKPSEQLSEVVQRYALVDLVNPFHRCTACNGLIVETPAESVQEELEPNTLRYYDRFYRCGSCGRVYWRGSHYQRMLLFIERVVGERPQE